jgi:predicted acyl esterase
VSRAVRRSKVRRWGVSYVGRPFRAVFLGVLSLIAIDGLPPVTARAQPATIHERDVAIPMRDGTILRADLLRPSSDGRFPTLVYRTPYSRRDALAEATTFTRAVERGYAVVVQDVRGRYGSAGEFRPYENEGRDGYDTIEWAASQPRSNGRVGTFGLSYPGAVQWLAAVENPPHLEAMVPAMTFSTPQNFFYSGGIWDLSWIPWIWTTIAEGGASVFYLSPAGPNSTRGSLTATPSQGTQPPSTLVSNPDDPVTNQYESAGVHDYQALATRKDVLTFDTAPLDRDLEVTGPIRARIYVSCDCRDTDLWVRVLDLAPNGTAWNLMSPVIDAVRVSYRDEQGAAAAQPW